MINLYLSDLCTKAKLILTDFLIQINIYLYLTAAYQYLMLIKLNQYFYLTDPDHYLTNHYRFAILRQAIT